MNNTKTKVKKMEKDLNWHTEKHDDEILEEKHRIVGVIVKRLQRQRNGRWSKLKNRNKKTVFQIIT